MPRKMTWKQVLEKNSFLQLPVAHDALSAKLIEDAGFHAYQIGGFAVEGTQFGYPDIDLTRFGEKSQTVNRIKEASKLPVLVDADDGYGDAKNVTRTVRTYIDMEVEAIFMEDQKPPKRCGHMSGKEVIDADAMVDKIKAALAVREEPDDLFLLARTDAIQAEGLEAAIERGKKYLKAGADGIYLEGPTDIKQLEQIGKAFKGTPLATSILERGGVTPWVPAKELHRMGFTMILYPATLVFRITRAMQDALADLQAGKQLSEDNSVDMKHFEEVVDIDYWRQIEKKFHGGPGHGEGS